MKALVYFLIATQLVLYLFFGYVFISQSTTDTESFKLAGLISQSSESPGTDSLKRIPIYDKGLQMIRGSYMVPHNWLVQQNISSGPYEAGMLQHFTLSFQSSEGIIIRTIMTDGNYKLGKASEVDNFEHELKPLIQKQLAGLLEEPVLGKLKADKPTKAEHLKMYVEADSMYQYLEASVHGTDDGIAYEGLIRILYPSGYRYQTALVISVIIAPERNFQKGLLLEDQIAFSYQPNPAYEEYCLHLREYYTRQSIDYYTQDKNVWHPDSNNYWQEINQTQAY